MLRELVILPLVLFFAFSCLLGEKWKEEHRKVEKLEKELEQCNENELDGTYV